MGISRRPTFLLASIADRSDYNDIYRRENHLPYSDSDIRQLLGYCKLAAESLKIAEDLLGFHEGSAKPDREGGEPVIWVNGEDFSATLAAVRLALHTISDDESEAS